MGKADGHKESTVHVRMLLPHEIMHCLANARCPMVFESIMLGNLEDGTRKQFLEHVRTLGPWKSHPCLAAGQCFERLIGLTFHADGAQFFNEDECFVWSVSSVFAKSGLCQDVLTYKFPFCIIPERQLRSKNVPSKTF